MDRFYEKIPIDSEKERDSVTVYSKVTAKIDAVGRQEMRNELLRQEIERLKATEEGINEITQKTDREIDILHRYNEIKDAAHELIGTLKTMRGTTSTAIYKEFGISLDD